MFVLPNRGFGQMSWTPYHLHADLGLKTKAEPNHLNPKSREDVHIPAGLIVRRRTAQTDGLNM